MAISDELDSLIVKEKTLENNKVAPFCYEQSAYENDQADGVDLYNPDAAQNIPLADNEILQVNPTVLTKGYRSQASSITRMIVNHFFGRTSYNLNKVNDVMLSLLNNIKNSLNAANGIAKLDENANLSVTHGGTGASNSKGAQYNLLENMNESSTEAVGHTKIACAYEAGSEANGAVYKRPLSTLSSFIRGLFSGSNGVNYTPSSGALSVDSNHIRGLFSGSNGVNYTPSSGAFTVNYGSSANTVCQGNDIRLSNSRLPTAHASTATTYGVSSSTNYGHAKASSTTPKANGTASVGSETGTFARGDHVHPLQYSVPGNAATATALQISQYIDGIRFNGSTDVCHFATCLSDKNSEVKSVTLDGFSYQVGAIIRVCFLYGNSVVYPKLKVTSNGTALGNRYIKIYKFGGKKNLDQVVSGYWRGESSKYYEMWQPDTVLELLYDGTDFVILNNPVVEDYKRVAYIDSTKIARVEGYRVRADGYTEQWGYEKPDSVATNGAMNKIKFSITGNFVITYSSACPNDKTQVATVNYGAVYDVTESGFKVDSNNGSSQKVGIYWTAKGYVW